MPIHTICSLGWNEINGILPVLIKNLKYNDCLRLIFGLINRQYLKRMKKLKPKPVGLINYYLILTKCSVCRLFVNLLQKGLRTSKLQNPSTYQL